MVKTDEKHKNIKLIKYLQDNLMATEILTNEDMRNHTTFKTGGSADLMIRPRSFAEVQAAVLFMLQEKTSYLVLGHGSNVLVSDAGIRETVLNIADNLNRIQVVGEKIIAQAGAMLGDVAKIAQENSLTGLEFAIGIPGTVGGGAVMNAGAYDGEIKGVLQEVLVLTAQGEFKTRKAADLNLGYRRSIMQENGDIVLEAILNLKKGEGRKIKQKMEEMAQKRAKRQPLDYPSAGSIFKRPLGHFTGKLIEEAGLKGYRIGGAQVSEKHSGFIINIDQATTGEILKLIDHVQKEVKKRFNVDLETEVRCIGEW